MRVTRLVVLAGVVALVACGSTDAPASSRLTPSAPGSPTAQAPSPSPSASPSPPAAPAPRPRTMPVAFSGLPSGTYLVHLHSACDGSQRFHITVLQSLVVRQGAGAIWVPSGYFNRGLCVIVYTDPSGARVLAMKRI